jgi:predicted alpha/beta superfamily hydrolase
MQKLALFGLLILSAGCVAGAQPPAVDVPPASGITGQLQRHSGFPSRHVDARNVDVWLPPSYEQDTSARYPVVYLQDGQNQFDPALAYGGVDWDLDGAMTRLVRDGSVREAILVGIWNTPKRLAEYMPQKALGGKPLTGDLLGPDSLAPDQLASDAYLQFLVTELKPFIDSKYRTLTDRDNTFAMGSSMGALVSAYAVSEYPEVLGGAGCVSTHWPIGNGIVIDYLARALPDAGHHKFYFDHGTATLDQYYEPYQQRMDAVMRRKGYRQGEDWISRKYDGAEHNEAAWRARADGPLRLLLGR